MSTWKGRKVLVTGATGLVGSWLVKRLLSLEADIHALVLDADPESELIRSGDIGRITVTNGDLRIPTDVARATRNSKCEVIFHLGAQTIVGTALKDPMWTFESNIAGTWNLLEAVRQSGNQVKSVVVASSDKAYGTSEILPYLEGFSLHGEGPYDVSKSCTDLIAQSYGKTYDIPVTVARCGNIYGGGDLNWSRIVPGTIRSLLHGVQPEIRSDGSFIRDYVYVMDIVDAYMHLAIETEKGRINGEAFNFSRDEPISVMSLYKQICQSYNQSYIEPRILNSAKSEIKDQHLDSSKAKKVLGWKSNFTLNDGLAETVNWYKSNLSKVAL
jgi:CDP-glucose 4,6-dehydratase